MPQAVGLCWFSFRTGRISTLYSSLVLGYFWVYDSGTERPNFRSMPWTWLAFSSEIPLVTVARMQTRFLFVLFHLLIWVWVARAAFPKEKRILSPSTSISSSERISVQSPAGRYNLSGGVALWVSSWMDMPQPPQLAPLNAEERRLYFEPLPDISSPNF